MSQLEFVLSPYKSGLTLISRRGTGSRETGVHLPKPHHPGDRLNVLLWFHGFYVKDVAELLATDGTRIREIVESSGKDLVLVAPHLGYVDPNFKGRDAFRKHSADFGAGLACESYLDEVLDAMARALPSRPSSRTDDDTSSAFLDIENLYIGCHSGGEIAMKTIVGGNSLRQVQIEAAAVLGLRLHLRPWRMGRRGAQPHRCEVLPLFRTRDLAQRRRHAG